MPYASHWMVGGLHVFVSNDALAMSRTAADQVLRAIEEDPELLMAAATGNTPTTTYELLVDAARSEPERFARLRVLKVDEWAGLEMKDPATCESYLQRHLIRPLNIDSRRYMAWNSRPTEPAAECQRIAQWLDENGPIGLSLLGLGINGHLAFIEPADVLIPGPHLAKLSPASLEHSMIKSARSRPEYGLTIGIADVMRSRRVLLLVSGKQKAAPLRQMVDGGITTQFPASFLKLHPNAAVLCDADAASQLQPGRNCLPSRAADMRRYR